MLGCGTLGMLGMLGAVRCGRLLVRLAPLLRERLRERELPPEPELRPEPELPLEPELRLEPEPARDPAVPEGAALDWLEAVRPREAWLPPLPDEEPDELLLAVERDAERERPDDRLLPLFAREVVAAILITSIWVFPRSEKTLASQYPRHRALTPGYPGWGAFAHVARWCRRARGSQAASAARRSQRSGLPWRTFCRHRRPYGPAPAQALLTPARRRRTPARRARFR